MGNASREIIGGIVGLGMGVIIVAGIFRLNQGGSTGVTATTGNVVNNTVGAMFGSGQNYQAAIA